MKEVRQTPLNTITGINKILLPADAHIVDAIFYLGLTLVYETERTKSKQPNKEFIIHVIASFDFVPISCKYIGTIPNDFADRKNDVLHIYQQL
jgi:hypothetical protein